jgi:MoaA/NifB/PqqE/SkfB family radical SAM enzyme
MPALATAALVKLNEATHRTFVLPLVVFYPTARCNSRCVSCDWWRHSGEDDLAVEEVARVASAVRALGTRLVVFSGGEPLLRPDVFELAALFRTRGLTLHLVTSGVLLERFAARVASLFAEVTISLDAADEPLYRAIRGVAALGTVERGVSRLRALAPGLPITARATLHRANFRELPRLVAHARTLGLDGISFLPADVSSRAFGRDRAPDAASLALGPEEIPEFEAVVERTIVDRQDDFAAGFVRESPARLRRLPRYYAALAGLGPFPDVRCNAPWVSVVIEANGAVRPCYFHDPIGNVRETPLAELVSRHLPAFRRGLDMARDPTCTRCVCSLKTGWRHAPWP